MRFLVPLPLLSPFFLVVLFKSYESRPPSLWMPVLFLDWRLRLIVVLGGAQAYCLSMATVLAFARIVKGSIRSHVASFLPDWLLFISYVNFVLKKTIPIEAPTCQAHFPFCLLLCKPCLYRSVFSAFKYSLSSVTLERHYHRYVVVSWNSFASWVFGFGSTAP